MRAGSALLWINGSNNNPTKATKNISEKNKPHNNRNNKSAITLKNMGNKNKNRKPKTENDKEHNKATTQQHAGGRQRAAGDPQLLPYCSGSHSGSRQ